MRQYICITVVKALLVLAVPAGVLVAAPSDVVDTLDHSALDAGQTWRRDLDLRRWSPDGLRDDLRHNIAKLGSQRGSDQTRVMMDVAELYMAHMLLFEAGSILAEVTPDTPVHKRRHRALSDAVRLLAGEAPTAVTPPFSTSPLAGNRPDRAFWASLDAIATSDVRRLSDNIEPSFGGLSTQPESVVRAVLPVLLEAAIELDKREYVDATLRLLDEMPELAGAESGTFLRARAAQKRGDAATALKIYLEAAEGWDQYAVRARLAVADMALADGGRGALLAAQSTLEGGSEAWRGGRYELEVLRRLERVYHALGNHPEAVLTLGRILLRFPEPAEAAPIEAQAQELLADIYKAGGEGQYPLSAWVALHLRLLPYFRYTDGFTTQIETLGDYVLKLGSTDLAAKEYRRAVRILQEKQEEQGTSRAAEIFRLNMKLAQAQVQGGQFADARLTLELMDVSVAPEMEEAHQSLLAQTLSKLGDKPALLKASVDAPTAQHLRDVGLALSEEERWPQAADVLTQLWRTYPQDFSLQDATRLLIAAYRSEDQETLQQVTRSFPSLTPSKDLISLANSISEVRDNVLPLSAGGAAKRLEQLENAFESIANSGISP